MSYDYIFQKKITSESYENKGFRVYKYAPFFWKIIHLESQYA